MTNKVTRKWVVDPTNEEIQTLHPVVTYRDEGDLNVSWQLHFSVNYTFELADLCCHTKILNRCSLGYLGANPSLSLLALEVVDCNFLEFHLDLKLTILQQKRDILSPKEVILDNSFAYCDTFDVQSNSRFKRVFKSNHQSDPSEGNIYWVLLRKPVSTQPIEITVSISGGSGQGPTVPLKSTKWISDCLAAKPSSLCRIHDTFWKMYVENRATDATIVVKTEGEDQLFRVHCFVLELSSPVMAAMFRHECSEKNKREIIIIDFEVSVVEKFIEFLYTDDCDLRDESDTAQLLACAEKYDVPKLKKKCQAVLAQSLNVLNAVNILHVANLHNANLLKDVALNFVKDNYKKLFSTPEWKSMTTELLNDIIKLTLDH